MKTIIVVIAIFLSNTLLIDNVLAASQISATINKNPVVVNESFILKITIDDDVDTNALNTYLTINQISKINSRFHLNESLFLKYVL